MGTTEPFRGIFDPDTPSGALASQIFEALPVAVFLVDPEHRISMLNERTARIAGMGKEEIYREGCFGLFCDKKTHFEKCPGHASLYSGEPWDGEVDLDSRHYHVHVRPLRDGDRVPYSLVVLDDRTDESRNTHLLNKLVERLGRLLVQSSRIRGYLAGFSTASSAEEVRDTSIRGAAELLGASSAYLVEEAAAEESHFAFQWFADEKVHEAFSRSAHGRVLSLAVAEAVHVRGEFVYVRGGGDSVDPHIEAFLSDVGCNWLLASEVKCGDRHWGRVGFFVAKAGTPSRDDMDLLHEVTALVGVALRRSELIDEVQSNERRLVAAAEEARAAARAKSMFLATMSHEIRTPLNAILGFSESLSRETGLVGSARECAEGINRSAAALLDLLNDILDLSKLEAGGGADMMRGECDLPALFGEMAMIFRYSAKARGIELRHSFPPDFPVLGLSGQRMRQILLNLIGNAVKFTERGFVEWTASCAPAGEGAVSLEIDVRDTGPGIPEKSREAIFDPFVQVTEGPTSPLLHHGTGLGLPIVRRLVEACGGTVRVESEIGKGSVFHIRVARVPVVADSAARKDQSANLVGPESVPSCVRDPDFLPLLVDDVPVNLQVLSLHLRSLGAVRPVLAPSGDVALAKMREKRPSVVFTDLWMPGMDGSRLAAAIRADHAFDGIPVVAVTADSDVSASFDASVFDDIITKPISTAKLAECLRRLFSAS